MQNKIVISEKSLAKVKPYTMLEETIYRRERTQLTGISRLAFTAKCFIILETIGLLVMVISLVHLVT